MLVPLCDWNSIEYNSNCQMSIDVDWCRNFVAVGTFGYFRTFPVLKWQLRQLRQIAELAAWLCTKASSSGPTPGSLCGPQPDPEPGKSQDSSGVEICRDLSKSVEHQWRIKITRIYSEYTRIICRICLFLKMLRHCCAWRKRTCR